VTKTTASWRTQPPAAQLESALLFLLFGLWLVARPYTGIWHDSQLYTAQALHRLYPEIYGADIFFRYGSQDGYTLFPALYAWAIRLWGIDQAACLLTLLGKLGWFAALVYLARELLRLPALWLGLAVVVSVAPFYGSHKVFSYGETFLTARLYAETFGLLALGFYLRRRPLLALTASGTALCLHPLMALPVLALIICMALPATRHTVMLTMVVTLGGLAVLFLSSPEATFAPLRLYEQDWFEFVAIRNQYVVLSQWGADAWANAAFAATIWISVLAMGEERDRRLSVNILLTTGLALLFAWLGTSTFQHVLLTQIQLWRFLWLFQLLALLMLAKVAPGLWKGQVIDRIYLGFLGCALLLDDEPRLFLAVLGALSWGYLRWRLPGWQPRRLHWLLFGLIALLTLVIKLTTLDYWILANRVFLDKPLWVTLLTDPLTVLLGAAAVAYGLRRKGSNCHHVLLWSGLGMMVFGFLYWDQRPAGSELASPARLGAIAQVQEFIPPEATVYWQDGLVETWFILKRAHYANPQQGAGVLFSRDMARQLWIRQQRLLQAHFSDGEIHWDKTVLPPEAKPTFADVRYLCQDPELGYVIMRKPVSPQVDLAFTNPAAHLEGYVYRCARLRTDVASYYRGGM
jgi:hypothetical protein